MASPAREKDPLISGSSLKNPECNRSRYGRIRKPKFSSDFCNIDDVFPDENGHSSVTSGNPQVTPKRSLHKETPKDPEQSSPKKVPVVTKTVGVKEEFLDTEGPFDLELVIPANEINTDNLWDTQILKANANTSKNLKIPEETYKERKFFKRTVAENEDGKHTSSTIDVGNEDKTLKKTKNEDIKHSHTITDVESDVTKVLKIVSNKNTDVDSHLNLPNSKSDVKPLLKMYSNRRKSSGKPSVESAVPVNNRKTRKSKRIDDEINMKPSESDETLLDFSWEQNYLSEPDIILLTKQFYENNTDSFRRNNSFSGSYHDRSFVESPKNTTRVSTILERKVYVKDDVLKKIKTESVNADESKKNNLNDTFLIEIKDKIKDNLVEEKENRESKQDERFSSKNVEKFEVIEVPLVDNKRERSKMILPNTGRITRSHSNTRKEDAIINRSRNESLSKFVSVTADCNSESVVNKEQSANENKTGIKSVASEQYVEDIGVQFINLDEDTNTKPINRRQTKENSLNQSEIEDKSSLDLSSQKEDFSPKRTTRKRNRKSKHVETPTENKNVDKNHVLLKNKEEDRSLSDINGEKEEPTKLDKSERLTRSKSNENYLQAETSEELVVKNKNEEVLANYKEPKHSTPKRSRKNRNSEVKSTEKTVDVVHSEILAQKESFSEISQETKVEEDHSTIIRESATEVSNSINKTEESAVKNENNENHTMLEDKKELLKEICEEKVLNKDKKLLTEPDIKNIDLENKSVEEAESIISAETNKKSIEENLRKSEVEDSTHIAGKKSSKKIMKESPRRLGRTKRDSLKKPKEEIKSVVENTNDTMVSNKENTKEEDKSLSEVNEEKSMNKNESDKSKRRTNKTLPTRRIEKIEDKTIISVNEELREEILPEINIIEKCKRLTRSKSNSIKSSHLETDETSENVDQGNVMPENNEETDAENKSTNIIKEKASSESPVTKSIGLKKESLDEPKVKEEPSSTITEETVEKTTVKPYKNKRLTRSRSKKNENLENEDRAKNADKTCVAIENKAETKKDPSSSNNIVEEEAINEKSPMRKSTRNKNFEVNTPAKTEDETSITGDKEPKKEDLDESKLDSEETSNNNNSKKPFKKAQKRKLLTNDINKTDEDLPEVNIVTEQDGGEKEIVKNEEVGPEENSQIKEDNDFNDVVNTPLANLVKTKSPIYKKFKIKLSKAKHKNERSVVGSMENEDKSAVVSEIEDCEKPAPKSSTCDSSVSKKDELEISNSVPYVGKNKSSLKSKNRFNLNKYKNIKIKSSNKINKSKGDTSTESKRKQNKLQVDDLEQPKIKDSTQNDKTEVLKIITGKQLFVRLNRLKSFPNLSGLKSKVHHQRSNSVSSDSVVVRKKKTKQPEYNSDIIVETNKKSSAMGELKSFCNKLKQIGFKIKSKKKAGKRREENADNSITVSSDADKVSETSDEKLLCQPTTSQEKKNEFCDCVMCAVSGKPSKRDREKSTSPLKNVAVIKKSASQNDIQITVDGNEAEKISTPIPTVFKKRVKSLPDLSEEIQTVKSSVGDELEGERKSVNDDFKTPPVRKKGRQKSIKNVTPHINKTSTDESEVVQKSESPKMRKKSPPKSPVKIANKSTPETLKMGTETQAESLPKDEVTPTTTTNPKKPLGRPRKRSLKSPDKSKDVKKEPVDTHAKKRKRSNSQDEKEKEKIRDSINDFKGKEGKQKIPSPRNTKLGNDVQTASPKRKKRKIDTSADNKIEVVQEPIGKDHKKEVEQQIEDDAGKVGDLLWAKIGRHPYWPCMITVDPKTKLFRRKSESTKLKEWWLHVRFFGDNGLRSWAYSRNTLPFRSKDDLDNLAQADKSDKKTADLYLSYKKMSSSKKARWKEGVKEAESLIDKTVEEKLDFFFNRFASETEKKRKLLNTIIDKSLLSDKQKKKLKMSILGRVSDKHFEKIMEETSRKTSPDVVDFKGTFSSTPIKPRKIQKLDLSKSVFVDLVDIARKIKTEHTAIDSTNLSSTTDLTSQSELEISSSAEDSPKKKINAKKLGLIIEQQLNNLNMETPKNKTELLNDNDKNEMQSNINEEILKEKDDHFVAVVSTSTHKSNETKTEIVTPLIKEELISLTLESEKRPNTIKTTKSKRKMKSPVKRVIISNSFSGDVDSSNKSNLVETCNQNKSNLNAEKIDSCENIVAKINIKMEPPDYTIEDVNVVEKNKIPEVPKGKRRSKITDVSAESMSDSSVSNVLLNDDIDVKEKSKKKKLDFADVAVKTKKKSLSQSKTEAKVEEKVVIVKTEKPDYVVTDDVNLNQEEIAPETDADAKTILMSLQNQVDLYKRNNLFRGVTRKQVCQICEKKTDVVRCKGPCLGFYHVMCAIRKTDSAVSENADSTSSKEIIENSDVEIVTVDPNADVPNLLLSPETKTLSLEDQIDIKMKEIMSKQLNKPTYEETSECSNSGDELSSKTKLKKEKKILKIHHVTADYVSFISVPEKPDEVGEVETIKSVEYVRTANLDESLLPVKEESVFKCSDCASETNPPCFVCKKLVSIKNNDVRQKCANISCGRFYHQECLKRWPQTQWSITSKSKGSKQIFFCPLHVCHTCVSDNPRGSVSKSSNENAKCLRCPATYHTSSYCIPAGTVILSNTQIICPRHLCEAVDKKSDKSISKTVNASWCFLCSKSGGTLICCDTCPTTVHEECLNVESELDQEDWCICEDCETGRLPLYDEIVWVKLGSYRWWPAVILFPNEVPRNVQNMPHYKGQFVVKFFGTHNHYWVGRGRVFLFHEGDTTHKSQSKKQVDVLFNKAVEEASIAHQLKKDFKKSKEHEIKSDLKPPHYIRIKINKPVGNVKQYEGNSSNTTACECNPDQPNPCGPDSVCLNRLLLTECNPEVCPAGTKCNNQLFEKRLYPPLVPFKTSNSGWGLKSLVPLYRGQFIIEYVGEVIDEEEYQKRLVRMREMKEENYYFLTIDKDRIIDAGPKGNLARFMNHSCQPNCETQKWTVNGDTRVGLFASEDIPENTELTFNYNLEYAGKEKKICCCGARNCVGFIGAKPVPKKIPKKKKPTPPLQPVVINTGPCFVCGEEGQVGSCYNKICSKFYHLKCVNLESWPDKWVCSWHNCNLCTKRTIRCCVKCTNSYCPSHSDGNIRYDKLLGFVCTYHDPNKETHVLQIEDIPRTPTTSSTTTAETDITSTTPDTNSSIDEPKSTFSLEDDEVSEITSNTQEIDLTNEKCKYAFLECQEQGVISNNIKEAMKNELMVTGNECSSMRKGSQPQKHDIVDITRSETDTPSSISIDTSTDTDEEIITKRKAEFDSDLPMRKRKKPRIEL